MILGMTWQVAPKENPMALDKDALSELLDGRVATCVVACALGLEGSFRVNP